MVKREDFKKRLAENIGLSLFEFIYTALQGYDYLYLYEKYNCRIQMGGNDQWMNILDGMDLISRKTGANTYAMTFPLLTDRSGQKMGKTSEGGTVWLAAEGEYSTSPFDFYQYWVNCPDEDIERNFKLFTFLPLDEIDKILNGHPRQAQHRLAFEVTKIVHGEEIAKKVQEDAMRAFGATEGVPEDVPTIILTRTEAEEGKRLLDILTEAGIKSRSEARRLIRQRGVVLNEERLEADDMMRLITLKDLKDVAGQKVAVIRFGKGKVAKVILN
jgi:tyrosyl-tRNA synthetase